MKNLNHIKIIGSNNFTLIDCQKTLRALTGVKNLPMAIHKLDNKNNQKISNDGPADLVVFDLSQSELKSFKKIFQSSSSSLGDNSAVIVRTSASRLECKLLGLDDRISVIPRGATLFDWKRAFFKQGIEFDSIGSA